MNRGIINRKIFLAACAALFIFLGGSLYAHAALIPIGGHAWSSTSSTDPIIEDEGIGWIQFSGAAADSTPYGVFVDDTDGAFSGHAWSSNVGWLSFNRFDTGAPPSDDVALRGGAGLQGYWKLDDEGGTTALDSSGNNNNGFLTVLSGNPPWGAGRVDTGLQLNGSTYVRINNSLSIDLSGPMSVFAWAKRTTTTVGERVAGKYYFNGTTDAGAWVVRAAVNNTVECRFLIGSVWRSAFSPSGTFPVGSFKHVGCVYDGANLIVYVDGVEQQRVPAIGPVNRTIFPVIIGATSDGSNVQNYFNGVIDDVRIYNRPLAPDEVREAGILNGGTAYYKFDESLKNVAASNLRGYWKFDEGGGAVVDSSTYLNDGVLLNGAYRTPIGKFGNAVSFDGTDDYINFGTASTLNIGGDVTVGAWIFPVSLANSPAVVRFGQETPYGVRILSTGRIEFTLHTLAGGWENPTTVSAYVTTGSWQHVAVARQGREYRFYYNGDLVETRTIQNSPSSGVGAFMIGAACNVCAPPTQVFNGLIDEVRVYNKALVSKEIRAIGSLAGDSTGNRNTGEALGGVKFESTGISEGGFEFDGVDDNIRIINSTNKVIPPLNTAWSVSLWFHAKAITPGTVESLMSNETYTVSGFRFGIDAGQNGPGTRLYFWSTESGGGIQLRQGTGIQDIAENKWYHAVVSYTGSSAKMYINGVEVASDTAGNIKSNVKDLFIGKAIAGKESFQGFMDDVRIYNFALTPTDVQAMWGSDLYGAIARLNLTNNRLEGWARFLSYGGDWDGWVHLTHPSLLYRVTRDGPNFTGYGWGGNTVVGWVSFKGVSADNSTYGVKIGPSSPGFAVTLSAAPSEGAAPLSGVVLTARVTSPPPGLLIYRFDCEDDGFPDDISAPTSSLTYTITANRCNGHYNTVGDYIARVIVQSGSNLIGASADATVEIHALTELEAYGTPVTGFAWASNVGWIKMSGASDTGFPYGVFVNQRTGDFSGYAWSGNTRDFTARTILADINASGRVDGGDSLLLAAALGSSPGDSNWNYNADLNKDSVIDAADQTIIARDFGKLSSAITRSETGGIGWINFAPVTTPTDNYPGLPLHGVKLTDATLTTVEGWARACAVYVSGCEGTLRSSIDRGGWDGWIKMSGDVLSDLPPLGNALGLNFDGTDDYVELPVHSTLNPPGAVTVSAWVRSASPTYNTLQSVVSNYSSYLLGAPTNGSNQMCFVTKTLQTPDWGWGNCTAIATPDQWHHFVGTYDSGTGEEKLYVDGVLRATQAYSGTIINGGKLYIGRREVGTEYFQGTLKEIRIYNRALSALEAQQVFGGTPPSTGLVGHWPLNEGRGTVAINSVDTITNGQIKGNPTWLLPPPGNAIGLRFDGINDLVRINHNSALSMPTNNFTIQLYLKGSSSDVGGALVNKFRFTGIGPPGHQGYQLLLTADPLNVHVAGTRPALRLFSTTSAQDVVFADHGFLDGAEHKMTMVVERSANRVQLYKDNALVETKTITMSGDISSDAPLSIGRKTIGPEYYFKGDIRDVRLYNRALLAAEIPSDPTTGLAGHWAFNEGADIVAADSIAGNNGQLINGPLWILPPRAGYGVTRNATVNILEGFAWGSDILGWINFCGPNWCTYVTLDPIDSVTLRAIPSSGPRPLTDVDLEASVVTIVPLLPMTYSFECDINDANLLPEFVSAAITQSPFKATDICDYTRSGTFTARVTVEQASSRATATARVVVFPGGLIEVPP